MVRIVDFKERVSNDGESFMSLIVMSGVEVLQSQNGNFYATTRKASIPSTFDAETCRSLIGQELPGSIDKVECEAYEYTHPQTSEVLWLNHRYVFIPEQKSTTKELRVLDGMEIGAASFEYAH